MEEGRGGWVGRKGRAGERVPWKWGINKNMGPLVGVKSLPLCYATPRSGF